MSVVKKNTYSPGNTDFTNVTLNVDLNRLGFDRVEVTWNGSQYQVEVGSLIEANGSIYSVEGTPELIGTGQGVVFFDSSTESFSINDEDIEYVSARAGWYSTATATKRATAINIYARRVIVNVHRKLGFSADFDAEFQFNGRVGFVDRGQFKSVFGADAVIEENF